ncbi:MAG TPA: ATP-binding cassette domain-containing protein [Solirubrobacteraceae bacterium]|jgi:energy-coupling factor transport system ATP-binding protein
MTLLELEAVSYWYPGAAEPALDDVSLQVQPGELIVVAGASGSGKSTLLRTVSGLVPHFHGGRFAGRAVIGGRDTREHGPGDLAATVGTLFQDPETSVVMGTVKSEVALALENLGYSEAAVARGVQETALALGIGHLLGRSTAELSGGELQRVALAAAMAAKPSLLVLDEPTSQLDPVFGDELMATLRRLNEDRDTAILLAEHRLERCLAWADRVLAVDRGRIVCDAEPRDFLAWAMATAPELATPGARLLGRLGLPPVAGVKAARAELRAAGLHPGDGDPEAAPPRPPAARRDRDGLRFDRVWHELRNGPAILQGVSLRVAPGERVALMGANGAGKSTLLRHAAGLMAPTRGRIEGPGQVRLLLQTPTDYLVHETVSAEASPTALQAAGLDPVSFGPRHPRELSVGEKQLVALAVILDGPEPPAFVCLDEPTRGLDRGRKAELARLIVGLPGAVIVATHDPEFVAEFAERVILLGGGRVIADGATAEVLARGAYFATETARILGGAGGALTPEQGAAVLSAREAATTSLAEVRA